VVITRLPRRRVDGLGGDDDRRADRRIGKGVIARRDAAADLEVDEAVGDQVLRQGPADHLAQGGPAHRRGDAQLAEAPVQPLEVAGLVGQGAAEHGPNLVDAVGELEAAVLDVHQGPAVGDVPAVDVGDAAHQSAVSSARREPAKPRDFSLR
jgi:hypothetical protein